ncbi:MAG: phage tail protein [Actinomycetaceae bacterium]|nr:phage tail protein [Actinomycetaceae bacterium]MDY5273656.1 phage tail protein [Arcanobacterium sp.]
MAATGTKNAANVSVGKPMAIGGVYAAPIGTPVPTDATTALSEAFMNLGYISDDGITNTVESDSEAIKAWGGDTVLTVQTSRTETFTYTMIESLNESVLKQAYGEENVAEGTVKHNGATRGRWVYVFEILLTGEKVKRIVAPIGEVTEVGDVVYVDGEPIGYEVTVTAYPDDAGNTAYEYVAVISEGVGA